MNCEGNSSFSVGLGVCALVGGFALLLFGGLFAALPASAGVAGPARPAADRPLLPLAEGCPGGMLPAGNGGDLDVTGPCMVGPGEYKYHNVNIYGSGLLMFEDATIDFWAESILIENGGTLQAGTLMAPIGKMGGKLTIHLYGEDQGLDGKGIECRTGPTCGVKDAVWNNDHTKKEILPGGVEDYFYKYEPLKYDKGDALAYFGYKVIGLSYGGKLLLYGQKGATYGDVSVSSSGNSWARLNKTVKPLGHTLLLDRKVDWQPGDEIVLTTTDYLPDHTEQLTVESVSSATSTTTVTVKEDIRFPHNGKVFTLSSKVPADVGPDADPAQPDAPRTVETRAAVALLSRSIRIVSEGERLGDPFGDNASGYYFGGHTVFRQGFEALDIHGVEFFHMGQGGRIMHYPVHLHMARKTPAGTTIADCSVHDSMTRWYTLHATQGVTLARNVGYLSIGHGYYFEDGTETDNKLYSNIGISVHAAVDNAMQNPRKVPGILAAKYPVWNNPDEKQEFVPFHSDLDHPTIFWIMNAYNDFEYNMAVGAGTCGACYWLLPGYNSGMSRAERWESYASEQTNKDRAATTPLYKFIGNYCSTAMNSFNTIGNTTECLGVVNLNPDANLPRLDPVENMLAPNARSAEADGYYPKVDTGGGRFATQCSSTFPDCGTADTKKCDPADESNCMVTVVDRYTTSFNWAEKNFSAIWLRPQWYLMTNSAITDVQGAGLSFITGGGYTSSDVIPGHWAVALKDIFIGNTQGTKTSDNPYAGNAGPFNPFTPLKCATQPNGAPAGSFCLDKDEGITMPITTFGVAQRLFNIYDGPTYEDSNAFLRITPTTITNCPPAPPPFGGTCPNSGWMYGQAISIPKDRMQNCYLPNAAIGWKQPNGFYYPPAFHSTNLFFGDDVTIRHYVIEPFFDPGTFKTDINEAAARYCTWSDSLFTGFTDVDRQTELNDDDGSLTGQINTVSVNEDPFFNAPVEQIECRSDVPDTMPPGTAKTSPYDYVTTVEYPACKENCGTGGKYWAVDCGTPACFGVPLYREDATPYEAGTLPSNRMMGQKVAQRSNMTVNHGTYYIDTTTNIQKQLFSGYKNLTVFQANQTYYTFLLFAKSATEQTYQMYVGPGFDKNTDVSLVRADVRKAPFTIRNESWQTGYWTRDYDGTTGVLTVKMNMGFPEFQMQYDAARSKDCQPQSFCSLDTGNNCGCSLDSTDGLYKDCQRVCANWAGKDVDCPEGGCYGFAVTLPAGFTTGKKANLPPTPKCVTKRDKGFDVPFVPADQGLARACYDPNPPKGTFCTQNGTPADTIPGGEQRAEP